MGIKVALEHRTSYTFDRLVEVHPHVVRLRPAPHSRTPIEAYSLTVEPADHFINWQQDAFGNFLARLVFPNRARSLTITVGLIADMKVINPFDFFIEDWAETIGFEYPKALAEDLKPYLRPVDENGDGSGPGDLTQAWVKNFSVAPGTRTIDFLVALNRAVNADVGYSVRMEPGVQTPDHTLAHRDRLVPRLGVAAGVDPAAARPRRALRFRVPGAADLRRRSARRAVGARRRLHRPARLGGGVHPRRRAGSAWTRRRACSPAKGHIPLSATPHPESAAPITGATEPCETTLDFSNVVTRVHEDPRVTLPYTEAAWGAINALGARVDERLAAGDVRLTVGGEPTFVSIDNQVDPEWTTDADGPHKRQRASDLAARLKKIWAPERLGAARPGQVVSRRTIAALADRAVTGAPTASRCGRTTRCWPTRGRPNATPAAIAPDAGRQVLGAIADGLGLPTVPGAGRATRTRSAGSPMPCGNPRASLSPPQTIWRPMPRRPVPRCWPVSTRPSPSPPPTCFRCTAATTTPAGPAPNGGCAAGASCCSKGIRPRVCGFR